MKNKVKKNGLIIAANILEGIGIAVLIIGFGILMTFAIFNFTNYMFMLYIGFGCAFIGAILTILSSTFKKYGIKKMNESQGYYEEGTIIETNIDKKCNDMFGNASKKNNELFGENKGIDEIKTNISCPKCGHINDEGDLFCTKCGSSLVIKCPNCGHQAKNDDEFCSKCGTKIKEDK